MVHTLMTIVNALEIKQLYMYIVFRKYFASIIPEVVSLSFITNFLSKKVIYTPYGALTSVQFNSIDISCYYPCNI